MAWPFIVSAGSMPFISAHPTNLIVVPGGAAAFTVASTNATGFQWHHNGVEIPSGTNATLVLTNAEPGDIGYYMTVAKNNTGLTPSAMSYLAVVDTPGLVPFSNLGTSNAEVFYLTPIDTGSAQVVAGPELDQMQPVGSPGEVIEGYFDGADRYVPNAAPGQMVYYRVNTVHTNSDWGGLNRHISTTVKLVAGGTGFPTPVADGLRFGQALGWPPPHIWSFDCDGTGGRALTNQTLILGEVGHLYACPDGLSFGWDLAPQWRKNGAAIPGATNRNLAISNISTADVGVYDLQVFASYYWRGLQTGATISQKYYLNLQTLNGQGVLRSPRMTDSDFVCDLEGVASRRYMIECSTNFQDWVDVLTVTNRTGIATFTNPASGSAAQFYRARLLPSFYSALDDTPY